MLALPSAELVRSLSCCSQVAGEETAQKIAFLQNSEGAGLSPFDCWLCLRGLKTMSLRMERQQQNAIALAKWLEAHPAVTKINYPGLPTDPGHALHMSQASGGGTLLSFETGDVALSKGLSEFSKLYKVTVSFGSTTSLLSLPCFMSHASIPAEVRRARGLPDDLVRISAGIEDERDLIADLAQVHRPLTSYLLAFLLPTAYATSPYFYFLFLISARGLLVGFVPQAFDKSMEAAGRQSPPTGASISGGYPWYPPTYAGPR